MFSTQFCDDLSEVIAQASGRFNVTVEGNASDVKRLFRTFKKHAGENTLGLITPELFYLVCFDNSLANLMVCACPCKASGFGFISAVSSFYAVFGDKGTFKLEVDENMLVGTLGRNKATVEQQQVRTPVLRRMLRVLEGDGGEPLQHEAWEVLSASLSALALDAYSSASTRRLDVYATTGHDGLSVMAFCGDDAHLGCVSKFLTRPIPEFRLCVGTDSIKTLTAMFPPPKKRKDEDEDAGAAIDTVNLSVSRVRTGLVFQGQSELLYVPNIEAKDSLYTRVPTTTRRMMELLEGRDSAVQIDVREFSSSLKQFKEVLGDDTLPVSLAFEDGYLALKQSRPVGNSSLQVVLEHGTAECENTRPLLADFRMLGEVAGSMRSGDWVVYLGDEDTAPVVAFDRRDSESLHVTYLVSIQA